MWIRFTKIAGATVIAALCCMAALPPAARAEQYDLMQLYRLAIAKDPALARAGARLEVGQADKQIARAALLPKISANGSVRQLWHTVHGYSGGNANGEYTGYSYGLGGAISLFNLPSYRQLSVADAGISSAEMGIQVVRQDLMTRLIDAYMKFLKSKADQKLVRDEMSRLGKIVEQVQAFLQAGTGDVIAVYEAKARFESASADLVKTEGQLRLAQQTLSSLTGITVESVRDLAVTQPEGPKPAEMEYWIETMRQRNPALLQAQEDLRQAEESYRTARAGHYPTIDGNGGYTADKGSTFLPDVETDQWYVGVRLNVPIYSGGETTARTRRALAGEAERRAMLGDVQEQAIRRLKEAYLNLQYNLSLAQAYQRKHESADLQVKAVQKGRGIGTRTAIDLLNAEQSYAVSSRDLAAALYDNLQRRLELKAAAGILNEEDLNELNGMLVGADRTQPVKSVK